MEAAALATPHLPGMGSHRLQLTLGLAFVLRAREPSSQTFCKEGSEGAPRCTPPALGRWQVCEGRAEANTHSGPLCEGCDHPHSPTAYPEMKQPHRAGLYPSKP